MLCIEIQNTDRYDIPFRQFLLRSEHSGSLRESFYLPKDKFSHLETFVFRKSGVVNILSQTHL